MNVPFRFSLTGRYGELEAVHRRSLAKLLIEGARRRKPDAKELAAYATLLQPVGRRWRRRSFRQLALLREDGWQLEGCDLLEDLLAGRAKQCSSIGIISLAIDIWPSPQNYLALGQMLLAKGQVKEAQAVYSFLMQDLHRFDHKGPSLRWRVREGLAAAWESMGKDRVACGCLTAGLGDSESGAGPLLTAFFLAFELGRDQDARLLGQQIDDRFRGRSKHFDACIRSLTARVALLREGRWVPPLASSAVFGEFVRGKGRSASVCRRLVGLSGEAI